LSGEKLRKFVPMDSERLTEVNMTWSLTIADILPARPSILWQLAKQAGVTTAVVSLPEGPDDPPVWQFET
jgi:hypothetical protein